MASAYTPMPAAAMFDVAGAVDVDVDVGVGVGVAGAVCVDVVVPTVEDVATPAVDDVATEVVLGALDALGCVLAHAVAPTNKIAAIATGRHRLSMIITSAPIGRVVQSLAMIAFATAVLIACMVAASNGSAVPDGAVVAAAC